MKTITVDDILFAKTQDLPRVFLGLSKQMASLYVNEMYDMPDFRDGVIRVTGRTTLVDIKRFVDFLRWKDANRYRYPEVDDD